MNQETKICQNCKQNFTIESEDFLFYEKIKVPPPTFCPECRLTRRLSWINSNTLYSRPVQNSEKKFISMYSEDKPFNIVEDKKWWQDKYDLFEHGADYNFNKPFFEQFLKFVTTGARDAYDYTIFGGGAELVYDTAWCGIGISNIKFSFWNYGSQNLEYCFGCHSSKKLFGSIGLRNKEYCILNKQYSKDEYFALREKIIAQMNSMPYIDKKGNTYKYGEFFSSELSPFCYNETTAQEYFPLTKDEAERQGYKWKEREERNYNITLKTKDIPDNIKDIPDTITKEIIECSNNPSGGTAGVTEVNGAVNCSTAFKILPQELEFYRKMNIPLPRFCPNCRHSERIKQRNPLKLWHRKCACAGVNSDDKVYKNTAAHFHGSDYCPNEFETTYSPERKEIVYCEACYRNEIY